MAAAPDVGAEVKQLDIGGLDSNQLTTIDQLGQVDEVDGLSSTV